MDGQEVSALGIDELMLVLSSIPFYKAVYKQDTEQFDALMRISKIFRFNSGEKILANGNVDAWIYFVVKGQLHISLPNANGGENHVYYVSPGEVVGDLSVYLKSPRTADVVVDDNCRETTLFGTDFSGFGELEEFSTISLSTKLLYYRHAVHALRWKLDMYRLRYHAHPLADKHREILLYTGPKDTLEELLSLSQQAVESAKLLVKWNQSFGGLFPYRTHIA